MSLALLALGWALYGAVHSLLASSRLKARVARRWPAFEPRYRLAYNVFAVVSVLPLVWATYAIDGAWLWRWTGVWAWIANGLALLALVGVAVSSKAYDMDEFLGLRPAARPSEKLAISGFHRHVRHPWYSLSLVLIWTRDMNAPMLVTALAITLYFVVGSRLEEKKLLAFHGEAYRRYMSRVPGLVPLPGKSLSEEEARELTGQ